MYSDSPQPWMSGTPALASKAARHRGGERRRGDHQARSVGTLLPRRTRCSSGGSSVGTTLVSVTDSARITSAQANGSNRSEKTRCPPVEQRGHQPEAEGVRVVERQHGELGRRHRGRSSIAMLQALASRFRCGRAHALGISRGPGGVEDRRPAARPERPRRQRRESAPARPEHVVDGQDELGPGPRLDLREQIARCRRAARAPAWLRM